MKANDDQVTRWVPSTSRTGHTGVTSHQKQLLKTLLPSLLVDPTRFGSLMDGRPIFCEIGFGAGEFMVAYAQAHPEALYIGCEQYARGVGRALSAIERENVNNIQLWNRDARLLLEQLPKGYLDRVHLLFPDPWPKSRHHKRRIVSPEFLDLLARVMKPGATLLMATDIDHYAAWMLERVLAHEAFEWQVESIEDIRREPKDWVQTRYQEKAIKDGRETAYILSRRKI
jgi:tRNA (guanine-N7-)-methyltransferase